MSYKYRVECPKKELDSVVHRLTGKYNTKYSVSTITESEEKVLVGDAMEIIFHTEVGNHSVCGSVIKRLLLANKIGASWVLIVANLYVPQSRGEWFIPFEIPEDVIKLLAYENPFT